MERIKKQRPVYDERDENIDVQSKSSAWDFVFWAAQMVTVLLAVRGNSAWKCTLSLIFLGLAANLICRFRQYRETGFLAGGLAVGMIGAVLLVWFAVSGQEGV